MDKPYRDDVRLEYFTLGYDILEAAASIFDDPAVYEGGERLPAFRRVRDEIQAWIEEMF